MGTGHNGQERIKLLGTDVSGSKGSPCRVNALGLLLTLISPGIRTSAHPDISML